MITLGITSSKALDMSNKATKMQKEKNLKDLCSKVKMKITSSASRGEKSTLIKLDKSFSKDKVSYDNKIIEIVKKEGFQCDIDNSEENKILLKVSWGL